MSTSPESSAASRDESLPITRRSTRCQAGAVGHVEHAAHFVLQHMGGEIAAVIAAARKAVVCQGAGPHDFRSCLVVCRILVKDLRIFHDGPQEPFRDDVRADSPIGEPGLFIGGAGGPVLVGLLSDTLALHRLAQVSSEVHTHYTRYESFKGLNTINIGTRS